MAGSGKTIVLALKAAYLHAQYPDWEIVLTYYTRSLWQQYRDLISKFVYEFSRDEPNWDKLHLFHAWGSHSEQGLYSEIAHSIGQSPINYTNAQSKFGRENAFSGICEELNQVLPSSYKPLYDLVLIDEAQDMPAPFFKLAYKCVKAPKRIVWAYDELQNLSSSVMPSINKFIQNNYELRFRIPTKKEMKKLRTINRERTASDARKILEAQKGVRTLLELVSKGELGASQIPELESLLKIAMNEKNNGDEYDESEE